MKSLILAMSFFMAASGTKLKDDPKKDENLRTITGKATYYASYFHGRRTSSGVRYSNQKYTAAHRTLPFGTEVTVTNLANGKSVVVTVNDRGPFNKRFIIDISQIAAKEIGIYRKGVGEVEISYKDPEP